MDFSQVFGVFSRRDKSPGTASKPLTAQFRYRVVQLCVDKLMYYGFWPEIHSNLQYLHGMPVLSEQQRRAKIDRQSDVLEFLNSCSDEHFIDFVEMIFQSKAFRQSDMRERQSVKDVNHFLRIDDLPYALTEFVREDVRDDYYGSEPLVSKIVSHPKIIRRENEVLHEAAIEPALTLLTNPAFASANDEFLDALKDYRKGDYRDCVTKCGSSLESVMKVICDRKRWSHRGNADATVLLKTILTETGLPKFFLSHIQIIPIIRNELSSAHGAGTKQRDISKQVALFVINSTASTILLLVDETNL